MRKSKHNVYLLEKNCANNVTVDKRRFVLDSLEIKYRYFSFRCC